MHCATYAITLAPLGGVARAATYLLPDPTVPIWVWPLLALLGILCQLLAAFLRRPWLLPPGLLLTLTAAIAERDITLAVGATLACAGLAYGMRKW